MLLNAQAAYYESDGQVNNQISQEYPGDSISDIGTFYITEEGGFLGNNYVLKARSYDLSVSAPNGTKVIFNGENVDMGDTDTKKLGVFAPGSYTVEGHKEYDYTTVKNQLDVTLFDPEDFEETVSLDLSGETVSVSSETPNTVLYVNDEKSEKTFHDETEFGPVKDGITLKGVAEFPWGKGESKPVTIGKDDSSDETYDLTPQPITKDKMQKNIKSVINKFAKNRITSQVKQKPDLLKNVSDNLKKEYTKTIENYDEDHYVKGKALGTRIDFSRVSYENGSGGVNLIHIPVEFHDEFDEVRYFTTDEEVKERFQERTITLKYNEDKQWIITQTDRDSQRYDNEYMTNDKVVKTEF